MTSCLKTSGIARLAKRSKWVKWFGRKFVGFHTGQALCKGSQRHRTTTCLGRSRKTNCLSSSLAGAIGDLAGKRDGRKPQNFTTHRVRPVKPPQRLGFVSSSQAYFCGQSTPYEYSDSEAEGRSMVKSESKTKTKSQKESQNPLKVSTGSCLFPLLWRLGCNSGVACWRVLSLRMRSL